jgi:FKBP-type peptidyl-prolyl cis-trans isomerase (trigger factor)
MNKTTVSAIAAVLILAVGAGAFFLFSDTLGDTADDQTVLQSPQFEDDSAEVPAESEQGAIQAPQPQAPEVQAPPTEDLSSPVAIVNGEEISYGAFEMQMFQMSQNPQLLGAEQHELQNIVLDQLIGHRLLVQAARDQNITIDEQVIEAELENVRNQFESPEMMEAQLEMLGMDEASLQNEIEDQAILNEYYAQIAEENNIEVTDEEIQVFYDEQVAIHEDSPSIEEVGPMISSELEQQKMQPYIEAIVNEYRESADIQILL